MASAAGVAHAVLLTDRDAALEAVHGNGMALAFASPALQADREVAVAAIRQHPGALQHASPALRGDREVVLEAVRQKASALKHALEPACGDREVVLLAIRSDPECLAYATDELRSDQELVRAAVEKSWYCLQYASAELKANRNFMLEAVRADGRLLRYASEELRADPQVVMAAVRSHGPALEFASDDRRSDYETVLAAVKRCGQALQFAGPLLRDDRRIVMDAVLKDAQAFRFASDRLHKDPDALAAHGLEEDSTARAPRNEQAPPPEMFESPDGFVEYRRPRTACWPVVLSAPHGGDLRPSGMADRTSGCMESDTYTWELSEEIWNEFGKGRVASPAMVRLKLHRKKLDANRPRRTCCDGDKGALQAWDAYHGWIVEALRAAVDRFGFCLLLDIHGQSHRRLVTELGYLVTTDDLLLMDGVLDTSTRPTSVDRLIHGPMADPKAKRPGGLANFLRGPQSLGAYLEARGFPCTPSPTTPEPVKAIPLYKARAAQEEAKQQADLVGKHGPPPPDMAEVTYYWGAYTVRRYGAPSTIPPDSDPLSAEDQAGWARNVSAIQLETSWIGVRNGILERRTFGENLCWATESILREWMGWVLEADVRA